MALMQWLVPHVISGAPLPHQYAANRDGVAFAMIRERANSETWRVSVFPSEDAARFIEAVAGSEAQAKRWVERSAAARRVLPVPGKRA